MYSNKRIYDIVRWYSAQELTMAHEIRFSKIDGLRLHATESHTFLKAEGSPAVIEALEKKLTIQNKSVSYRLMKLSDQRVFWAPRAPFSEEASIRIEKINNEIKELESQKEVAYFWKVDGDTYIPAGCWWLGDVVDDHHMNKDIPLVLLPGLRNYQVDGLTELMKYKRGTLVNGTGLGKTYQMVTVSISMAKANKRTMIVVPSDHLVGQTVSEIKKHHASVTGASSSRKTELGKDILVTTVGTAAKYADVYNAVVIDECIPYDQPILTEDGPVFIGVLYKKFKDGEKLPLVASFNELTRCIEYKPILNAWKKRDRHKLIKIKTSRLKTRCTPDHKILTQNGWVEAHTIKKGDILYGPYVKGGKQDIGAMALSDVQLDVIIGSFLGDGHIQTLAGSRKRLQIIHGEKQRDYLFWKAAIMDQSHVRCIPKNGYAQTPAYQFSSRCFDLHIDFPSNKKTCPDEIINLINARSLAIWYMDDGSVRHTANGGYVIFSVCSFDDASCLKLQSKLLQMGMESFVYKCKKGFNYIRMKSQGYKVLMNLVSPYIHPCMSYKGLSSNNDGWDSLSKPAAGYATYSVDAVDVIDYYPQNGVGYGLFDLEVANNHNYILSSTKNKRAIVDGTGIIAHNCHHAPAATWTNLLSNLENTEYVYNFTATPIREDGMAMGIHAYGGPTVFKRDAAWGIANDWLCHFDVHCKVIKSRDSKGNEIAISDKALRASANKKLVGNNYFLSRVAEGLIASVQKGRRVIVLGTSLDPLKMLAKICKGRVDFSVADANFKKPLHDFALGKTNILVATSKLVSEGVDIPDADVLFLLTNHSSMTMTYQALGRILRKSEGKPKPVVFDCVAWNYAGFLNSFEKRLAIWQKLADNVTTTQVV